MIDGLMNKEQAYEYLKYHQGSSVVGENAMEYFPVRMEKPTNRAGETGYKYIIVYAPVSDSQDDDKVRPFEAILGMHEQKYYVGYYGELNTFAPKEILELHPDA